MPISRFSNVALDGSADTGTPRPSCLPFFVEIIRLSDPIVSREAF
jgi:hypothetical protein